MCITCYDFVSVLEIRAWMKIYNTRVWEKTSKTYWTRTTTHYNIVHVSEIRAHRKISKIRAYMYMKWSRACKKKNCYDIVNITKIRACVKYQKQNLNVNILSLQWNVLWYCQCARNWNFSLQVTKTCRKKSKNNLSPGLQVIMLVSLHKKLKL